MATGSNESIVRQWRFNQRGKIAWRAMDEFDHLVDLPAEGEITKENRGRIDSFAAVGPVSHMLPPGAQDTRSDGICLAQFVRIDNRAIKLKLDPPDIVYAYRYWLNGVPTIIGDVGLWHDTFVLTEEWEE